MTQSWTSRRTTSSTSWCLRHQSLPPIQLARLRLSPSRRWKHQSPPCPSWRKEQLVIIIANMVDTCMHAI